ncbi:hypothetical protein COT97_03430 [Candidatus Falkowbacteria bacterium CG10_big_fil_rev_8_21_14_0_10_39_11]|uniref:Uncharacterized protein n=1 Tax=Candidatus Falkowbacteria bacterium CG10_big_fil_rev_8_21_14_0_10_39_11 TaxID=1974565 RepID=A0A2H0V6I3_9BACT|nr:MAG: hypothetical protein COT97_03430 [Candidatus Falkowbacteria bacterium CG10_big_fil_rev_8_21_14_0_10_39_11]
MNDMSTRRLLNKDGSMRSEEQLQADDKASARTVEYEVRHAQYYDKYARDLDSWKVSLEKVRPLSDE